MRTAYSMIRLSGSKGDELGEAERLDGDLDELAFRQAGRPALLAQVVAARLDQRLERRQSRRVRSRSRRARASRLPRAPSRSTSCSGVVRKLSRLIDTCAWRYCSMVQPIAFTALSRPGTRRSWPAASLTTSPFASRFRRPASRMLSATSLASFCVARVEVDVVGDQELARADDRRAEPRVERGGPRVGRPRRDRRASCASALVLAGADVGEVAPRRVASPRARRSRRAGPAPRPCAGPSARATSTHSSIVTPATGTIGQTSSAPMRGCAPCVLRHVDQLGSPRPRRGTPPRRPPRAAPTKV